MEGIQPGIRNHLVCPSAIFCLFVLSDSDWIAARIGIGPGKPGLSFSVTQPIRDLPGCSTEATECAAEPSQDRQRLSHRPDAQF
jgi:hypothetical protein